MLHLAETSGLKIVNTTGYRVTRVFDDRPDHPFAYRRVGPFFVAFSKRDSVILLYQGETRCDARYVSSSLQVETPGPRCR